MKPAQFVYHAPKTVKEAVALLAEFADAGGRIIAGGQSLIPMMAFRIAAPSHLIDINGVEELGRLGVEGKVLEIGALVRHSMLESNAIGDPLGQLLSTVARSIAHVPIRNRGTFCGSLAHADPASEWCLVAIALSADIVVVGPRGERSVSALAFFKGIMTTDLAANELVAGCRIPILPEGTHVGFEEVSRRAGDFAMAAALVTYRLEDCGIIDPRIAVGGVEAVPRRLAEAESFLVGVRPSPTVFRQAAEIAAGVVQPMPDERIEPGLRRRLTRAMVERALMHCLA